MSKILIIQFGVDDLLAFDKPYQMAYSGSKAGQAQMDRILQNLKASIAPEVQRLCLVKSLDKDLTGVILFAKYVAFFNLIRA